MNIRNHMNKQKFALFVKENFKIIMLKIKNIAKLGVIFHIQVNIEVLEIHIVFDNGSNYDYHFIIK